MPVEDKPNVSESSTEELAERDRLAELVIRKALHAISTSGFTVERDMGKEARGNPYGADVFLVNHLRVGLSNPSGKRYRAELDSSRIVGGPIRDALTLVVNDQQDAELGYGDGLYAIHRLIVHRARDKTVRDAGAIDNEEMSVTLFRLHRGNEEESGTFNLPISEQLGFLREVLEASVDPKFTEDIAHVAEYRLGKVRWNKDDPNAASIKKLLQTSTD